MRTPLLVLALVLVLVLVWGPRWLVQSALFPAPKTEVGQPPPGWQSGRHQGTSYWIHEGEGPVVLYFHGNGEHLGTIRDSGLLQDLLSLGTVICIDFPGYGNSLGKATPDNLIHAARSMADWARSQYPDRPLYAVGWSLGAAVAAQLDGLDGLVLLSPWTSLENVSKDHYPSFVVWWAVPKAFDTLSRMSHHQRVLVVHGDHDPVIPHKHGLAVAAAAGIQPITLQLQGHVIIDSDACWKAVRGFIHPL
ncbi:MAG: alpha/beta fold hydrolase [Acidobacteria bacterium]|nr:alpha/beta fold hydrolase [Acidobacteriota bacterium]